MRQAVQMVLSAGAAAVLSITAAFAQTGGGDVFTVAKIPVQAEAADATKAKFSAQRQGRREALDVLLRRLASKEDWDYLPRLAAGLQASAAGSVDDAAAADPLSPIEPDYLSNLSLQSIIGGRAALPRQYIALDDRQIEELEAGIEIFDEKNSATAYRASVSYSFKPSAIRDLLREAQLPYSEVQASPALVLPILEMNGRLFLWEPENPWAAAWRQRPLLNELTPIVTPFGELEDIVAIDAKEALAFNQEKLAALAERYDVAQVIVAHARWSRGDAEDTMNVRFRSAYNALPATVDVVSDGVVTPTGLSVAVGDVLAESWKKRPTGAFRELASASIDAIIADYSEVWKQRTLIDHSAAKTIYATAHFRTASDWIAIRKALTSAPIVESVEVQALSRDGAYLTLRYLGEANQLRVALEQSNLSFWSLTGSLWNIAEPVLAAEVQANTALAPGRDGRVESRWRPQANEGAF